MTEASSQSKAERMLGGSHLLAFFPEAPLAAIALVLMPVWIIGLLLQGNYSAAAWASAFTGVGAGLGWFAWQRESRPLLYFAIIVILIAAYGAATGKL